MAFLVGRSLNYAITATAGSGFLLWVDEPSVVRSGKWVVRLTGVFRFGYDQGVMSSLLTGDAFVATFPEIDTTETGHGSSSLQGTVWVV